MTPSSCRTLVLSTLVFLSSLPLSASPPASLPENYEARVSMRDTIFAPVSQAASAASRSVRQLSTGDKVSFKTEIQAESAYLIFYPPGMGSASIAAAGTYVIKRSMKNGAFLQAKIFVQDDPGSFLRLFPKGDRTQMDVVIGDEPFQTGISLPLPFERLLTASFQTIVELSDGAVDWPLVLPPQRTEGDARLERIVAAIRPRLTRLADTEDGAMDSGGRFVYIRDGTPQAGKGGFNCSGFAKFVIDGFYAPLTGRLTDIGALKERNLETRGNRWSLEYEQSRDPYFGLDWSRNLARALGAARMNGGLPPIEFADVRGVERFSYVEDVGYPIDSLHAVLYILARRDPGAIYIGSLNREAFDGAPVRQHHHLAVFFPYVDGEGILHIVVMERNLETSIASLKSRFPRDSVHLVRVGSEGEFRLP